MKRRIVGAILAAAAVLAAVIPAASQPVPPPSPSSGSVARAAQSVAEARERHDLSHPGLLTAQVLGQAVDRAVVGVGSVDAEGLEAMLDRVVTRALGSSDAAVLEKALDRAVARVLGVDGDFRRIVGMERSDARTAVGLALMVGGAATAVTLYMNRGHDFSSDPIFPWGSPFFFPGSGRPGRLVIDVPGGLRGGNQQMRAMTTTQQSVFLTAVAASVTGTLLATVWSQTPVYATVGVQGITAGAGFSW